MYYLARPGAESAEAEVIISLSTNSDRLLQFLGRDFWAIIPRPASRMRNKADHGAET